MNNYYVLTLPIENVLNDCYQQFNGRLSSLVNGNRTLDISSYMFESGEGQDEVANLFSSKKLEVSVSEAFSSCFLALYESAVDASKGITTSYRLAVSVQDDIRKSDKNREAYFGDGILERFTKGEQTSVKQPMQHVSVIATKPNGGKIEELIIHNIERKKAKRHSYHSDWCALVVSVFGDDSTTQVDLQDVLQSVSPINYQEVYVVSYGKKLRSAMVFKINPGTGYIIHGSEITPNIIGATG